MFSRIPSWLENNSWSFSHYFDFILLGSGFCSSYYYEEVINDDGIGLSDDRIMNVTVNGCRMEREFWDYKKMGNHLNQFMGSSSSIGAKRVRNVCVAFRAATDQNNRAGWVPIAKLSLFPLISCIFFHYPFSISSNHLTLYPFIAIFPFANLHLPTFQHFGI